MSVGFEGRRNMERKVKGLIRQAFALDCNGPKYVPKVNTSGGKEISVILHKRDCASDRRIALVLFKEKDKVAICDDMNIALKSMERVMVPAIDRLYLMKNLALEVATDSLTGVYNRRYFTSKLSEEMVRGLRCNNH